VCVSVHVCVRERERERESTAYCVMGMKSPNPKRSIYND